MDLVPLLFSGILLAAVGLVAMRESRRRGMAVADLAVERERVSALQREMSDLRNRLVSTENELGNYRQRLAVLEPKLAAEAAQLRQGREENLEHRRQREIADSRIAELMLQIGNLEIDLAKQTEKLSQERKHSEEQISLLRQVREEFSSEFKSISNAIILTQSEVFVKNNTDQVGAVLQPLREKLLEFQTGLIESQREAAAARGALEQQLRQLLQASEGMRSETTNLTRALKGRAQTQGSWGEMVLATVLEKSGLRKGEEYLVQASSTNEDGQRLRPDIVVSLAGGRRIVIDAKVSLTAFEGHVNAATEAERASQLSDHVTSLRNHINSLGKKAYQQHIDTALDYVIMFVPIEGALAVALQEAPSLTTEALSRNVMLATPTTLMLALRTVAHLWQVERRNVNAEQIAQRAGLLFDKFVGFIEDMESIGKSINASERVYKLAMNKLSHGTGNLVRQTEELRRLGAKNSKSLPENLLIEEQQNSNK